MRPTSVTAGPNRWVLPAVSAVLIAVLATAAVGIAGAQRQARQRDLTVFSSRVGTSATYVAAAVTAQAQRQVGVATALLAGPTVDGRAASEAAGGLGAVALVVTGPSGTVVASSGAGAPALVTAGATVLARAATGGTAVSEGIGVAGLRGTAVMIAVPFRAGNGSRVLGAVYASGGAMLAAFVSHVSVYRGHHTFLVDDSGAVIAADPPVGIPGSGLPYLPSGVAAAVYSLEASAGGGVRVGVGGPGTTVAEAPVQKTSWHVIVVAPDAALFAPTSGVATVVPWLVWGAVLLLAAAMIALVSRFVRQHRELVTAANRLSEMARTDELTGMPNRRSLVEEHERLAEISARHSRPYAVLMADLDRFKEVNDTYGHEAGDRYLVAAAECLRRALRDSDVAGRWGGDEFLALLPETGPSGADEAARRVVDEGLAMSVDLGPPGGEAALVPVRFSAGWAEAAPGTDPDAAVRAADHSLYRAKASGNGTDGRAGGGRRRVAGAIVTDPAPTGRGPQDATA